MQVWQAFGGYSQIYGRLPSARTVRRVTLYLAAQNEYEAEQQEQQRQETEELKREAKRNAQKR